jgi:hypothetical protein
MDFEPLDTPKLRLTLKNVEGIEVPTVDAMTWGILHVALQEIADKVAFYLLSEEGLLEPRYRRPVNLPPKYQIPQQRFVQVSVYDVGKGSLWELLAFGVAAALADPHVIAVLDNLAANVIWGIGMSAVRGVDLRWPRGRPRLETHPRRRQDNDPFEIGPNLREVLIAAVANPALESLEIAIEGEEQTSVEMKLRFRRRRGYYE